MLRRLSVSIVAVVILTASACGGGEDVEKVDADDWVADICDAVDDLNEVENAGMADLEEAYSDAYYEEDGDLYRDAVVKYTRDYGKALDRFARDAEDAGEPDVEGGEEIAAAVQDYVKKEQRAFERVSREVKALKQTGDDLTEAVDAVVWDVEFTDLSELIDDTDSRDAEDIIDLIYDEGCSEFLFDE